MHCFLDIQFDNKEEEETSHAPERSYELTWLTLKGLYPNDCKKHEDNHEVGRSHSDCLVPNCLEDDAPDSGTVFPCTGIDVINRLKLHNLIPDTYLCVLLVFS